MLFCVPNVVNLYELQMKSVKYFSVDSIKCESGNKENIEFSWFFMASDIWDISNMNEICNISANTFPFLKHLQAMDPPFVTITKPLSNKREETFCEGLKWMCKPFEKWTKRFIKTCHFLKIPWIFYYKTRTEKLISILLSFIFGIRNSELISSEL